jgi:hypothetical protein
MANLSANGVTREEKWNKGPTHAGTPYEYQVTVQFRIKAEILRLELLTVQMTGRDQAEEADRDPQLWVGRCDCRAIY